MGEGKTSQIAITNKSKGFSLLYQMLSSMSDLVCWNCTIQGKSRSENWGQVQKLNGIAIDGKIVWCEHQQYLHLHRHTWHDTTHRHICVVISCSIWTEQLILNVSRDKWVGTHTTMWTHNVKKERTWCLAALGCLFHFVVGIMALQILILVLHAIDRMLKVAFSLRNTHIDKYMYDVVHYEGIFQSVNTERYYRLCTCKSHPLLIASSLFSLQI